MVHRIKTSRRDQYPAAPCRHLYSSISSQEISTQALPINLTALQGPTILAPAISHAMV